MLVALAFVYFAARLLFFAFALDPAIPPDEQTHVERARYYASTFGLPSDSEESYPLGLLSRQPCLYYFLAARLLPLDVVGIDDRLFLRLLNVPLGLLTVLYGYRWLCLVTRDPVAWVLFVVIATNVLMFTFLSATVNYDNLVNLLAAMSFYYLFAFLILRRGGALAAFGVCVLAGCLTKVAFLPLAAILCSCLVWHERRSLYPTYLSSGAIELALQGRYLFPVLMPLCGLIACLTTRRGPVWLRLGMAFAIGGFFAYGDLPYFLIHATPGWLAHSSPEWGGTP